MRGSVIALISLSLLIGQNGPVAAAPAAFELSPYYHRQCQDVVHGRWADFAATLAADYVGTNLSGPPDNKSTEPKSVRELAAAIGTTDCSVRILSSKVEGNSISANIYFTLIGSAPKSTGYIHKGDKLAIVFHSTDHWQHAEGALVQDRATTLGVQVSQNGNLVRQKGAM